MTLTPVKTPMLVKRMFPNYIWNIPTAGKTIYLTFDDGPTPDITNWTLDVLKQYNAKATFFCIGHNIEKHPEIFQHIINDGHAIGNHTHNHIKGWKTKTKDYLENVSEAEKVINSQIKVCNTERIGSAELETQNPELKTLNSELFRPPYGQIKPKQGKQLIGLGYKIIMWDVLSFDWDKNVTPEGCLNNVISKSTNGSIIVFHDSVKASKNMQYALPKVLEYFNEKGYSFKSLKA
ncbi:polysaccharide deacetylase family protein [Hwangdonia seohaensis]|uniref:Polysaccharide deacetylase family protein n=1 Tax=Hwangdonia seohaensis TaxID=1240727 RepID=A0ABW3R9G1_9FLAO|nr:polysaccharide deacetylase family protein [Hwangdonia seohaensis]